jgi:hypothetical protein
LLEYYRNDTRIMAISGNNFQMGKSYSDDSYYFSRYNHIWGWASWRRAWKHYDFRMTNWLKIKDDNFLNCILDAPEVLSYWSEIFDRMYKGEINTWDYQWTFSCWSQNALTVLPEVNLVSNIGFGVDATHTVKSCFLENLPVAEMKFPLVHPKFMMRNSVADRFTDKDIFKINIFMYVKSKIKSLLNQG